MSNWLTHEIHWAEMPISRIGGNQRGHWAKGNRARQQLIDVGRILYMQDGAPNWPAARIAIWFRVPDLRKRDLDGLMYSLKAYIDGVVRAGLVPDDDWQHLAWAAPVVTVDADRPGAVVTWQRCDWDCKSNCCGKCQIKKD